MSTKENKLIAEFMGIEFNAKGDKCKHPLISAPWPPVECLMYHSSWDWIMPVVERIETMDIKVPLSFQRGFMKNTPISTIKIDASYDNREEFRGWTYYISFFAGNTIKDNDFRFPSYLECIYSAVLDCLKWYNKNNLSLQ